MSRRENSEQKIPAIGCGENLFLIATPDGIAPKAKTPDTVYLTRRVDVPDLSVYSILHLGENLPSKTRSTI